MESGKFLESGIWEIFLVESGILGFGIWNSPQGMSGSPQRLKVPPSKNPELCNWNPESRIQNPLRGIQNTRLSWIPLHE